MNDRRRPAAEDDAPRRTPGEGNPGREPDAVVLFEHLPEPVVYYEYEETTPFIGAVNGAFETTFGCDADEAVGAAVDDLVVPPADRSNGEELNEAVRRGEPLDTYVERQTADGVGAFLLRNVPLASDGPPRGYAIYVDITERRERERALERYAALVEATGDPMYVLDRDGRITRLNEAMAELLGAPREEIRGSFAADYVPASAVEKGATLVRELLCDDERRSGTFEMTLERPDGTRIVCEDSVALLVDDDGAYRGSVGVLRDVTERSRYQRTVTALHRTSRELLAAESREEAAHVAVNAARSVLDMPFSAVLLAGEDETLRPLAVTDELSNLYEEPTERLTFAPGEGLAGRAFAAREETYYDDVAAAPAATWEGEEPQVESLLLFPLGDHGVFLVGSPRADAFNDVDSDFARILASNAEAALSRAERDESLRRRERELARQNERLEGFASAVSHDLRSPLNVAGGYVSFIREERDSEELEIVANALSRMEELIDDLLELARQGGAVDETEPVSLAEAARAAWVTAGAPDARLEIVEDGVVEADPSRLRQLFENLFRNAVEHGGSTVTVSVETTERGFAVADDGPGILADERDSVFEWGYSTSDQGTGFGLAIVEEVAGAHGWRVELDEDDGDGEAETRTGTGSGARFEFLVDE